MTSTFELHRHVDHSGVSGTGVVAEGAEFTDGAVALRWPGQHPSTATWGDMRDMEAIHGHDGDTVVQYTSSARLLAAYQRVVPHILFEHYVPRTVAPHPDHPDRLRVTLGSERDWRFWVALLEGSTHAATHEEVDGEMRHTWITPDGNVWLIYHTPPASEDRLKSFDREDR